MATGPPSAPHPHEEFTMNIRRMLASTAFTLLALVSALALSSGGVDWPRTPAVGPTTSPQAADDGVDWPR